MLFCYKVSKEFPKILKTNQKQNFNINNISIQKSISNKKINCYIEHNNQLFKICSLQKNYKEEYSCLISLTTNKNKEFKLKIDGDKDSKINFIGFIIKEDDENTNELKEENKNETKNKIKENINKQKNKDESDEESEDDILSEKEEGIEIEELLNKKRKETPQDIKPLILSNLNQNNIKNNSNINKNQKIQDKNKNNKINLNKKIKNNNNKKISNNKTFNQKNKVNNV
jgi:hypothetical protein